MDVRGITRVEILVVGLLAILVIAADVFGFWFLGQKTHDLRTLSEVQQIRAGLEAFAVNTTVYPLAAEITPLNDPFSNTEKLCEEGFERFTKECDKVIMPYIPNTYAGSGETYLYRSQDDARDYQLQFEIRSNFVEVEIPKEFTVQPAQGSLINHVFNLWSIKNQKGFSIIELLVVIAIIAILAIVGVVALNSSRAKARDAKRLADIRQVQTALEFYYSDEDAYPIVQQAIVLGRDRGEKLCDATSGGFVSNDTDCVIEYMLRVPSDPVSGQANIYLSDGQDYIIQFETEQETSLGLPGTYQATSETISRQ